MPPDQETVNPDVVMLVKIRDIGALGLVNAEKVEEGFVKAFVATEVIITEYDVATLKPVKVADVDVEEAAEVVMRFPLESLTW